MNLEGGGEVEEIGVEGVWVGADGLAGLMPEGEHGPLTSMSPTGWVWG